MDLTVLIPTYRRPHDLRRCLDALAAQARPAEEVLVVVRDTDAETRGFLADCPPDLPNLRVVTVCASGVLAAMTAGLLRRISWSLLGARFGRGTSVPPLLIIWPHQVSVGADCILEPDIYFKYDGPWQPGPSIVVGDRVFVGRGCEFNIRNRVQIGSDTLIASGCKFIDHDHAMTLDQGPMNRQPCPDAPIILEDDVWLGVNVVVLKGVTIGTGAVVGAGAIVTKSIPACEIWAGVPARKVSTRSAAHSRSKETGSQEFAAA